LDTFNPEKKEKQNVVERVSKLIDENNYKNYTFSTLWVL
jgi:hypothetical protein